MTLLTHTPLSPRPALPGRRWVRRAAATTALCLGLGAGLAGCGGGVVVGLDLGYGGVYIEAQDAPPAVSMVASASSVRVGEVLRLVAAASDDWQVDSVSFYQVDAQGQNVRLRTLDGPPWTLDVQAAPTPSGVTYFWARAFDGLGQSGDSELVRVNVLP